MVGVISYLPDGLDRVKRWETSKKCLKNMLEVCSWLNAPLHLVTTGWSQEELSEFGRDNIIFYQVPLDNRGPAVSRNILLRTFYHSDDDYLLMCDDDTKIYSHYEIQKFFVELHTDPKKFISKKLYRITSLNGKYVPFKEQNMKDVDFRENWVFTRGGTVAGANPQIIVNFKKYFGVEWYQREDLRHKNLWCEDVFFDVDLLVKQESPLYTLTSFISGNIDTVSVCWQGKSDQDLWESRGQPALDLIKKLYPGVRQTSRYLLDTSAYFGESKKRILVPRNEVYSYSEIDLVKKRKSSIKHLGLLKNK